MLIVKHWGDINHASTNMENLKVDIRDPKDMQNVLFCGVVKLLMKVLPRMDQLPAAGRIVFHYERQGDGRRGGVSKVRIRGEHQIEIRANGEAVPVP